MKTTKIKATQFSDGGHSWLGVKRSLVEKVGAFKHISRYSYQRGEMVYLEEYIDVAIFFKLFFAEKGLDYISSAQVNEFFDIKNSYKDTSPVRSYSPFRTDTVNKKDVKAGQYIKVDAAYYFVESPFDGNKIIIKTAMGQRFKLVGAALDRITLAKEEN